MTQIEIDMKRSLLLAELWKMLRETQLKMETQIVPLLSELDRAPLGFGDFLRSGVPITLVTTAVGVLLLWIFWGWGWL